MVVGFGAGGEHVVQALLPEFEAIIHIVIRHRKLFFVQPARRAVERGFGHQAGPGDRHVVLRRDQPVEIPHRRARVALVAVPGRAVDPHDNPGVLDRIVGVVELRPDRADVRPLAVGKQFAQKIR